MPVAVASAAIVVALAGCGSSSKPVPAADGEQRSALTLTSCAAQWNRAVLWGDGGRLAAAAIAYSSKAMMFASQDGVCGLAFPSRAAAAGGEGSVFVSVDGGDYSLALNPVSSFGADSATARSLAASADRRTNVTVQPRTKTVVVNAQGRLSRQPVQLRDATADCKAIPQLPTQTAAAPQIYKLRNGNTACSQVRAVIWEWDAVDTRDAAHSTFPPAARPSLMGWACQGDAPVPDGSRIIYEKVTCHRDRSKFSVTAVLSNGPGRHPSATQTLVPSDVTHHRSPYGGIP